MIKHMTVYSHNLKDPSKSFSTSLQIKDFSGFLQWDLAKAKKITYVNPKGEELQLEVTKVKRGIYDVD
jgi:hypothetical protein